MAPLPKAWPPPALLTTVTTPGLTRRTISIIGWLPAWSTGRPAAMRPKAPVPGAVLPVVPLLLLIKVVPVSPDDPTGPPPPLPGTKPVPPLPPPPPTVAGGLVVLGVGLSSSQ